MSGFSPSTQEIEAGESLSLRPDWLPDPVPRQVPKLKRETLSQKKDMNRIGERERNREKQSDRQRKAKRE